MLESQKRQVTQFLHGSDEPPVPSTSRGLLAPPNPILHPRSAPEHFEPHKKSKHSWGASSTSYPDEAFCSNSAPCTSNFFYYLIHLDRYYVFNLLLFSYPTPCAIHPPPNPFVQAEPLESPDNPLPITIEFFVFEFSFSVSQLLSARFASQFLPFNLMRRQG